MSVIIFVAGVLLGFLLQSMLITKNISGNLRMKSDDEDAYLFVELNKTVDKFANQRIAIFKVNQKDWDSLK